MSPAAPLRAVLFDAVGTLIRLAEPVGETYARRARDYGVELPASRIEEAFGRVLAAASPMVFPEEGAEGVAARERGWWRQIVRSSFRAADAMVRFDDFEGYFEELWRHYGLARAWRVAEGAEEALEGLQKAGLALGVVSNFDLRLRPLLRQLGLHARFQVVALPGDCGAAKPERKIFDVALKRLGLPPHQALYVGDREDLDLAAARAAGLQALDVRSLATLAELPERVQQLGGTGATGGPASVDG